MGSFALTGINKADSWKDPRVTRTRKLWSVDLKPLELAWF